MRDNKKVVAITGHSGCGKSYLGRYYAAKGYTVIDCDKVAADIHSDSQCQAQLCEAFGSDVVKEGIVDKAVLAQKAFADSESLQKLTDITHPFIINKILETIDKAQQDIVFVDGAVIIGHDFERYCDKFIVVVSDRNLQYGRLVGRDGISVEQAKNRIEKQTPQSVLLSKADFVIYNNGSVFRLENQGDYILRSLKKE